MIPASEGGGSSVARGPGSPSLGWGEWVVRRAENGVLITEKNSFQRGNESTVRRQKPRRNCSFFAVGVVLRLEECCERGSTKIHSWRAGRTCRTTQLPPRAGGDCCSLSPAAALTPKVRQCVNPSLPHNRRTPTTLQVEPSNRPRVPVGCVSHSTADETRVGVSATPSKKKEIEAPLGERRERQSVHMCTLRRLTARRARGATQRQLTQGQAI